MKVYSTWRTVALDADDLKAVAARKAGAPLLIADGIAPFRPVPGLDVRSPFA